MADPRIIITCEHGGNAIPPVWQHLFSKANEALAEHEGYDPGALPLARLLTEQLHAELHYTTISRLLVDCNRSLRHPKLFSKYTHRLSAQEKRKILDEYYLPYRKVTEEAVNRAIKHVGRVLHISVHTFSPHLHGKVRNNDIGLLYDPARKSEKDFCLAWQQRLQEIGPQFRVRRNYPYLGKTDGLATTLRKKHGPSHFVGVELEINAGLSLLYNKVNRLAVGGILVRSLTATLQRLTGTWKCFG